MVCDATSTGADLIACAIAGLAPAWWEPWLGLLGLLLSVVVPVVIAVAVSRHSRKVTLEAVERQINAARIAAKSALISQMNAERQERRDDEFRAAAAHLAQVVDRQLVIVRSQVTGELPVVAAACTSLELLLPAGGWDEVRSMLRTAAIELAKVRSREGDEWGSVAIRNWVSKYHTIASLIFDGLDPDVIVTVVAALSDAPDPDPKPEVWA
jgi:hypothetical protein